MNPLKNFLLKYLMFIILNFTVNSGAHANFGNSCVPLPTNSMNDNYLLSSSVYGHIVSNIDMTSYITNACDPSSQQLSFCLKNSPNDPQSCTKIVMNVGDARTLGSLNNNPDLGGNLLLANIILTASKVGNNICLMMPTSTGIMPLACKATTINSPSTSNAPNCTNISNICYGQNTKSQSILNFTGNAINCLTQTLDLVFYKQQTCASDPSSSNALAQTLLSPFPFFQASLQNAVLAALIIYVMFHGFKMVMNSEYADLNNVAGFLMKFLLVAYFAIGIGPTFFSQSGEVKKNGVTEFMLPFLTGATANFAQIVFNGGGIKGLCTFDQNKYQAGYESYAIWDAIDCRVGYYLGMQLLYNNSDVLRNITNNTPLIDSSSNSPSNIIATDNGISSLKLVGGMPFFSVLFGFLLGGNIVIVIAGLMFAVIFISIVLQFISTYLVCLVTIYVMAYISPIFVTMALFKATKSYFDSWLKIIISCALQPAILAGFIAILLTTYDNAIFGGCEFQRHDYSSGNNNFSTFELRVPAGDPGSCQNSTGYKLLQYYNGQGWIQRNVMLFAIDYLLDVFDLMLNLLYVSVFTFIFYFFSKSISQFASDITSGPGVAGVTVSPTRVIDQAKKVATAAAGLVASGGQSGGAAFLGRQALKSADDIGKKDGGGGEGGDKQEGGESKDSLASGDAVDETGGMGGGGAGGGASDMIGR